eukprot:Hpha_TRINITY_DN15815_c2_g1::TRINITY_DN15815_c2_g1_i2::g.189629::m.189629
MYGRGVGKERDREREEGGDGGCRTAQGGGGGGILCGGNGRGQGVTTFTPPDRRPLFSCSSMAPVFTVVRPRKCGGQGTTKERVKQLFLTIPISSLLLPFFLGFSQVPLHPFQPPLFLPPPPLLWGGGGGGGEL